MFVCEVVVNEDGVSIALPLELLLHVRGFGIWYLQARPAIPFVRHCFGQATQASDQAARGHGKVIVTIVGALDGQGQTVGDDEQAAAVVQIGLLSCHPDSRVEDVGNRG